MRTVAVACWPDPDRGGGAAAAATARAAARSIPQLNARRALGKHCGNHPSQPGTPGTWFQLALVLSATGAVVGDCGLHCRREDPRQTEVGITVAAAHQGRGYATEAVAAVLDFIFDDPRTHRVSAVTDAENAPAAALFRRLGFRQEAHFIDHLWFKGRWGSEFVFALLRREWERRRTAARETTAGRPPFRGAGTP